MSAFKNEAEVLYNRNSEFNVTEVIEASKVKDNIYGISGADMKEHQLGERIFVVLEEK